MSILNSFIPAKRRVRRKRRAGLSAGTGPGTLAVLGIENVSPGTGTLAVTVVFDVTEADPLTLDPAPDAAKWIGRYDGKRFVGNGVLMQAYDRLRILMAYDSDEAGMDQVAYLNSPSDIADTIGRQLAAFSMPL